jgi:hypothetical protein
MVEGAATRFPARGQSAAIRPYRKNLMWSREENVRFDVFSEEDRAYVESRYAYAEPAVGQSSTDSMVIGFGSMTIPITRRFSKSWKNIVTEPNRFARKR